MPYRSGYYARPRSGRGKKGGGSGGAGGRVLLALALPVLFLCAFAASFFAFGGFDALFPHKAEPGYVAQGPVRALRLTPPEDVQSQAMAAYFAGAVAFAEESGYNTLIFPAKSEAAVWWRDEIFPTYPAIAAQGEETDPLGLLCEALRGKEIQLWVEVHPYAGGGEAAADAENPPRLTAELGPGAMAGAFAPADEGYQALLVESLAGLPLRYPIGGIVLGGFSPDAPAAPTAAEQDSYSLLLERMATRLQAALAAGGRLVPLHLAYDAKNELISAGVAQRMRQNRLITYQLGTVPATTAAGEGIEQRAAAYGEGLVLQHTADDETGVVLFAVSRMAGYGGLVTGQYPALLQQEAQLAFVESVTAEAEGEIPLGYDVPRHLEVTYPADGARLSWDGVYMTGHSDPAAPLLLNGAQVAGRAPNGAFGVFVPLALGDNVFHLQNGDVSAEKTITRQEPKVTSSTQAPVRDHTRLAEAGQAVRIVSPTYANILTAPDDVTAINEIFPAGAVAVVRQSQLFQRYNSATGRLETTASYQLTSGDWVWAINTEWLSEDGHSAFTGLSAQPHEKGEVLVFAGTGTPGAYISCEEGVLRLTFYDTAFTLPEGFSSELVSAASVEAAENGGVALVLQTRGLWGYSIEYENGQTRLFLKRAPQKSADPAKPLGGVHVMLDAGHGVQTGGSNYGAVGLAGETGTPHEWQLNRALAGAIAWRLRQLGATVTFTVEGDANPGINERYLLQQAAKPDFFLSIHHDALDGNTDLTDAARQFGIYYHPYNTPPSRLFAENLMADVGAATGLAREDAPRWGGVNYGVIRTTVCPSVLFEYALIVNPAHYAYATSTEGIWTAAFATARALVNTLPG